jgi:hypothetical protein
MQNFWSAAILSGVKRLPRAGGIAWKGGRRWTDLPPAARPHPRVGVTVQQRELIPHPHPPRHDIQPWLGPVRGNPAPRRQHTVWRRPASRREHVARLGGDTPAIPRRTLGAVPASRGKRPWKAPTQPLHACIIDRAARSVEVASPLLLATIA